MTSTSSTAQVAAMDFDEMLAGVSGTDTAAPELRMIPVEDIYENEKNFYSVDDVKELADSIAVHGLLDPIVVTYNEPAGMYQLISGHRRFKAWNELWAKTPKKYAEIPAIVRTFSSPAMAELALIMANSTARVLKAPEIYEQAQRIERLLYDLREEGVRFPGRMREQVAKACQVSSTKLARLKVIDEHLADVWRGDWKAGKLPEETAYQLAQASVSIQQRIRKVSGKDQVYGKAVASVRAIMEAGNDYSAADLTGPGCDKCTHGDAFLRHDLEYWTETCECKRCCLECQHALRDFAPCDRACSKAKALKSAKNAKLREEAQAREKAKRDALREAIRQSAVRLLKAADAAGVPDDTPIKLAGYGSKTVAFLRNAAADGDIGYVYTNDLESANLDAGAVAKALGCSADYVCGLTDELQPTGGAPIVSEPDTGAPRWKLGDPPADGRYIAGVEIGGLITEQIVQRSGSAWYLFGEAAETYGRVVCWWPVPRFKPERTDLERSEEEE